MLNIYFGEMSEAIYNTSVFFDNTYLDIWLEDKFAIDVIKNIDKGTVVSHNIIDSKALGAIPVKKLSGGAKTLLLMKNNSEKIFNASTCGDNCAKWILKIAEKQDVTINLHHIMDFGEKNFEIKIVNNDITVTNMVQLIEYSIQFLQGGEEI